MYRPPGWNPVELALSFPVGVTVDYIEVIADAVIAKMKESALGHTSQGTTLANGALVLPVAMPSLKGWIVFIPDET